MTTLPTDGVTARQKGRAECGLFQQSDNALMTVLNFSAGTQSSLLLWMVILGVIPKPNSFAVINANPGMENIESYAYTKMMRDECRKVGIYFETADGPDLRQDLVELTVSGKTRIDNPPYWVLKENGKVGRLQQKCTKYYKIAPMDRAVRKLLARRFGISEESKRLPEGCVERWIGFAYDEMSRVTYPEQKYVQFRYPLIEMKLTKSDVVAYFRKIKKPLPPRSVCNACFANGLNFLKDMHANRPSDWRDAVEVDESIRDMSRVGIAYPVFVSRTCVPLADLAAQGFKLTKEQKDRLAGRKPDGETLFSLAPADEPESEDSDDYSCDSGYCFT